MTGRVKVSIEPCIRIMSRWGKENIVRTDKEGFTVVDPGALATVAAS